MDSDGYGPRRGQNDVDRLLEDCRTLSTAGIERVAAGWDRHAGAQPPTTHGAYQEAERAALHAVETGGHGAAWDDLRNRLLNLTERGIPLVAWRAEHGEHGHKAENALLGAALALLVGPGLDRPHRETLLRPMAEALPWLLTG